ncbi:MAG: anaerobic ribonucleoside-triphosphate reductase [Candidatus Undinarchaeales archaeon]|nr:anaerobic ribonucleoside-triphosphate reductase [Candidatus Undinarchaeales archaeon]
MVPPDPSMHNPNKLTYWFIEAEMVEPDKIATLCMSAGATYEVAEEVTREVEYMIKPHMKMSDIKPLIFEALRKRDRKAASKFMKVSPIYVRTSRESYERFARYRVEDSLVKETGIKRSDAHDIGCDVERFLKKNKLAFVSAPMIREIVNFELLKRGHETERSVYTRVGMPVFDLTRLVENRSRENANLQYNSETIHKLAGDHLFKEYALLNALPQYAADAHLQGKIHIHDLDYFVLRPFCFSHDLRFFLRNGYNADGSGIHSASAGPANHAAVAILHATKVLASAQTNCAGGQGYNWFNTLLAPYMKGKSYKEMKQLAQMFIYEMSQIYVARGGQTVFSSIDIEPSVPKQLLDVPAVLPGGKVDKNITYGDFQKETNQFFKAIIDVFSEGDYKGKPFNFPKCEVKVTKEDLKERPDDIKAVDALAAKFGTPYYFLQQDYMPEYACYQCCSFMMPLSEQNNDADLLRGTVRGGALQVVTLNLPNLALEAKGSDEVLMELLHERMNIARDVHVVKRDIINKRIEQGSLPFLSQPIDDTGTLYLEVDKQALEIGLVGLNEMVKLHTGEELHESTGAWAFGLNTVKEMSSVCNELSEEMGLMFGLSRTPAESTANRLATLDIKRHGTRAFYQGEPEKGGAYYTNSTHIRPSADLPLFERIKREAAFHPLLSGGAMTHIWLGEAHPSPDALNSLTERILSNTLTGYFAYTKDFTLCGDCDSVHPELVPSCVKCTSKNVDGYSRITGYYQKVSGWNAGKVAELADRKRYPAGI